MTPVCINKDPGPESPALADPRGVRDTPIYGNRSVGVMEYWSIGLKEGVLLSLICDDL